MSVWTHINGTVIVSPMGKTQAQKDFILKTVLNHLPQVTGSEGDMEVYTIQKNGYNSSSSCDEFGEVTNNLVDNYGYKDRNGWLRVQEDYIIVLNGDLRDREFKETFRELNKWLCRLAKRVIISDVLIRIEENNHSYVINQNYNNPYHEMFETPSWNLDKNNDKDDNKKGNWCEFMMGPM